MIYLPIILSLAGLFYMFIKRSWVLKQAPGTGKMKDISESIYKGALSFLKAEYKLLSIFVIIASLFLAGIAYFVPTTHYLIIIAFIFGAFFSALAGNMGMRIATKSNVRTTNAAIESLPNALKISFGGGIVMGLGVAGLAVLGLTTLFILFFHFFMGGQWTNNDQMTIVLETLTGFSLGAESIALFARVGGGIYTKAADVGADLVGKVEAGIPEDDPRNPATIADNVGDNVGDVAGMGADLFGSYVATVLAAMVLGNYIIRDMGGQIIDSFNGIGPILLPIVIAGVGIIISIIGTFFVKISSNDAKEKQVQRALNIGNWTSIVLVAISCYFLIEILLPAEIKMDFFGKGIKTIKSIRVFYASIVGLVVGGVISSITEYYTGLGKKPILRIVEKSSTGAATNIIAGLGVGMISTFASIILFALAIWISYDLSGFYGVAIAATTMMATTAMQLAIDAFGPIADNAGGIAEMSGLPEKVRKRTDILDSVGNTTAATGKGFAIASAALTSLALFAAYITFSKIDGINIYKAPVLAMLFIGGMVPVVFSALAINSVGKAAMKMVNEVRRQFKEIKGILEGKARPEYEKCIEISTNAALKEMVIPGLLAICTPIVILLITKLLNYNNLLIAEMLGGYMAGVTVSGVLWAIFQNNAGGAWDNAKKSFEAGVEINGEITYKGSDAHKAAVTGDTVGDPFKDTSGPSMNILIKLTCLICLIMAPILGEHGNIQTKEENITQKIITTTTENQKVKPNTKINDLKELSGIWVIDLAHSFLNFSIRHGVSKSTGTFQNISGYADFTKNQISIKIKSASINTNNMKRDKHLKNEDFFNTEKYSDITFFSNNIERINNSYVAKGIITMLGESMEIELPFNYNGKLENEKMTVTGFEGKITIDRTRFGMKSNIMLGDEVDLIFNIELNPKKTKE